MKVIIYLTTVFVVVFSLTLLLDDVQCARPNSDLHKKKGTSCKWCNKHCQKSKRKSIRKQRLCKWRRCNRCQAAGDMQGNTQGNDEESKEKIVAQHGYTKDSCEKWGDYKESCLAIMSLVSYSQIPFKCENDEKIKNLVIDFDESGSASFKNAKYKFEGESKDPKDPKEIITGGECKLHLVYTAPAPGSRETSPLAWHGVKFTDNRRRRLLQGGNGFNC